MNLIIKVLEKRVRRGERRARKTAFCKFGTTWPLVSTAGTEGYEKGYSHTLRKLLRKRLVIPTLKKELSAISGAHCRDKRTGKEGWVFQRKHDPLTGAEGGDIWGGKRPWTVKGRQHVKVPKKGEVLTKKGGGGANAKKLRIVQATQRKEKVTFAAEKTMGKKGKRGNRGRVSGPDKRGDSGPKTTGKIGCSRRR